MTNRKKNIYRNSDLFAAFIAETLICSIISTFVHIPSVSVVLTMILLIAILINNQKSLSIRINSTMLLKVLAVAAILIVSGMINGIENISSYILFFVCFGLPSIVFLSVNYDVKRVFQSLIKLYFAYLIFYILFMQNDFTSSDEYWKLQMGVAYGLVPIVVLSVLVWFYPAFCGIKKWIALIIGSVAFCTLAFDTGTRGALVVVFINIMCILLTKISSRRKIFFLVFVAGFATICFCYYREIVLEADYVLSLFGVRVGAIDKMIFMMNQTSEANGRDVLFNTAKEYFLKSPIWGNGVGFFEKRNGIYPHSIIWQLLCEYGLMGLLIVGFALIKRIKQMFFTKIDSTKILSIFLFGCSVPMLFFSNTYWLVPMFWIFFFMDKKLSYKKLSSDE